MRMSAAQRAVAFAHERSKNILDSFDRKPKLCVIDLDYTLWPCYWCALDMRSCFAWRSECTVVSHPSLQFAFRSWARLHRGQHHGPSHLEPYCCDDQ